MIPRILGCFYYNCFTYQLIFFLMSLIQEFLRPRTAYLVRSNKIIRLVRDPGVFRWKLKPASDVSFRTDKIKQTQCWLFFQPPDADGPGSTGSLLLAETETTNLSSGDCDSSSWGDRCYGCSCHLFAGPLVQCRSSHQVIAWLKGLSLRLVISVRRANAQKVITICSEPWIMVEF